MSSVDLVPLQSALDDAVLDWSKWQEVCDRLAVLLGGVGTVIVPEAVELQLPGVVASNALGGLIETIFRDGWISRNYRRRAIPIIKQRGYATDFDIADDLVMRRDPFYAELLAPQRLGVFVGLNIPGPRGSFIATVERSIKAPVPDASLLELAASIQPMLASSARATMTLAGQRIDDWKALAAESNAAVFLIDRAGNVIDRNEASEALVENVFDLGDRRLKLLNPAAEQRLVQLVEATRHPDERSPLPPPLFVDGAGMGRLMIDGVRLPRSLRFFHVEAAGMIVVRTVESETQVLPRALRLHAHLTEAELRVAMALFEGVSLQDFADTSGLTVGTARQQLKSVLRKTGTNRQGELLTMMRRLSGRD